jgi:hypothetical protein
MPVVPCAHCASPVTLPDDWSSPGFTCPHCHRTSLIAGGFPAPAAPPAPEPLPLPEEPDFTPARAGRATDDPPRQGGGDDAKGKALIFFGYAAFVLVPAVAVIALAVYKFGGDGKPDDRPVARTDDGRPPAVRPGPAPGRKTRPERPAPRVEEPDDDLPLPKPVDAGAKPQPTAPEPPTRPDPDTSVSLAPEPRRATPAPAVPVPEPVALAPEPRVTPAVLPAPPGYVSDWVEVGPVEARVAGVAVTRVPVVDADGREGESPVPVLAVWVEVRLTPANGRAVELKRWQDPLGSYAEVTTPRGMTLERALLGSGRVLRSGVPYKQVLPPDGAPRTDVVVFAAPPEGAGDLKLVLDADRVGQEGKIRLPIPAKAWEKR